MTQLIELLLRAWRRLVGHQPQAIEPLPVAVKLDDPPVAEPEPPPSAAIEIKPTPSDAIEREPKQRHSHTAALRNELANAVTGLIEKIATFDMAQMADRRGARDYEEALGYLLACDFHYVDELMERMNGGSQWTALVPDEEMREMIWPVDIAAVSWHDDDKLTFSRLFTATPASLRGRVRIVPPRAAWIVNATVLPDGKWYAQMSPIGLINGEWKPLDDGIVKDATSNSAGTIEAVKYVSREQHEQKNRTASILQSLALTERYNWHVAIGQRDGPRVLLPTNPRGCLALFKTREKREDETRRTALRHWVRNHLRQHGDREIAYVRDHLRGVTEFNWKGFNGCEVFVSEFDLDRNELFRQQAAEWRSKRKHNRIAVRIKRDQTETERRASI